MATQLGEIFAAVYTFNNAEVVVDDLGERGEAVGGAGGVGHHVVPRLVLLVVHTLQTLLYKLETEIAVLWNVDTDVWLRIRTSISSESGFGYGSRVDDNKKTQYNFFFLIKNYKKPSIKTLKLQEKSLALKREHTHLK
jgi:hypothetical protein